MKSLSLLAVVSFCALGAVAGEAPLLKPPQRWVHIMTNISSDQRLERDIELMKRAAKAGYTGFTVNDVKFIKYNFRPATFDENFKKWRQALRDNKLDFIACVTPMGYANDLLTDDPNLAEGMPIRDAMFVVKDGKLVPLEQELTLVNGSLDEFNGDQPVGWEVTDAGKISFADQADKTEGKACLRQQDAKQKGLCRLTQTVKVKPYHSYHVSLMVKTDNCESKDWRIQPNDGKMNLAWQMPPIEKTMGWKRIHMTFDSLDNTSFNLMIGSWGAKNGKVWWDDVKIEPGGFVNIIRRDSLPLKITSLDGKTLYTEGKDFSEVKDPKLGHDPNPGYFTIWHDAPVVTIPAGSQLKEGDKVLASYHIAVNVGKPHQIMCCMSEPKTYELIESQIKWVKENLQPDSYFMSHDEIRHQGWDESCVKTGKTCGQILSDNVKKCAEIIVKVDPGKPITIWNDMVDPFHNARKTDEQGSPFKMYLARGEGPWDGSWEGMPKSVGITNWAGGKEKSYQFFSQRGHQQIFSGNSPDKIAEWLKASGKLPGVVGVMFTNWDSNFSEMERYIEAVKAWEKESGGFGK